MYLNSSIKSIFFKKSESPQITDNSEEQQFIKKTIQKCNSAPNLTQQVIYSPSNYTDPIISFHQPHIANGQQAPNSVITSFIYPFKGYLYAFVYVLCICVSYIFIKMSFTLNTFNHMLIRYTIQLIIMAYFLVISNLNFLGPTEKRLVLSIRGLTGMLTLLFTYFSIQFLNVSDVESLSQCNTLITAVLGRILLKEKLTIWHLVSILLTFTGVMLILRPQFLFGFESELESIFHINQSHSTNQTGFILETLTDKGFLTTSIGTILSLLSAFFSSVSHIAIKKLCQVKTHFAIISIYPVFFGLPISMLMSFFLLGYSGFQIDIELIHLFYSILSGFIATVGLIFLNKALKHEETVKISVIRTSGVLFSFFFQYLILGYGTDFLGLLGAGLIVFGTLSILFTKLCQKNL